jgi:hypothetical protein
MAIDNKYGQVTLERGTIGEDEPVVVFRAQDKLLMEVLAKYYVFCEEAGSPRNHLDLILDTMNKVAEWRGSHPTKVPSSDGFEVEEQK